MTLGELKAKILLPQDKANHNVFGSWIGDVVSIAILAWGFKLAFNFGWVVVVAGIAGIITSALIGGFNDWIDKKEGGVFSLQDVGYTALGGLQVGLPLIIAGVLLLTL